MNQFRIARLADLVSIVGGGTPARNNPDYYGGDIPWATPKDMKCWNIEKAQVNITEAGLAESSARLVPAQSILIVVRSGVLKHTLPVGLSRVPVAINQDMKALLCTSDVEPDYLARFIKAQSNLILSWVRATTADNFPVENLKEMKVPLPPIEEQRRIAEVLDRADELHAKRREALAHLDDLSQSIFLDMFGNPAFNEHGWTTSTLGDAAEQVTDGEHLTPKRSAEGVKLLSARNVRDGYLDFSIVDHVPAEEFQRIRKRCEPRRGDILISCSGTIGRVAAVDVDEPLALVRSVALVRPKKALLLPKFLEAYLQTSAMKARMLRSANASSQANLFQGPIRALPVFLPPPELQDRFQARLAAIDRIRAAHHAGLAELDAFFASLQDRAFRGLL
ncbi:type I restriction enzyme, S subunit [Micromonospora viridifaciens]|uniref:Type I restriction enzyme, S subunit n=1 Tax=Micromonospora viridifaciens TaxID=1881 RepID=A0A1C4VYE9_MICVI|nr:restriction endonuclease subunit S [Micromonospora viridifaciens]SCE88749.1 type I restriction enzyme, S subunit [Micromonospora viridifaciens]